jgi:hypothetical protein
MLLMLATIMIAAPPAVAVMPATYMITCFCCLCLLLLSVTAVAVAHRYQDAADARFANWTSQECVTKECLLAHARAGLVVDLGAVKQLLMSNMKVLLAGTEGLSS